MDISEAMIAKRIRVRKDIEDRCKSFIEKKIDRYLELDHQKVIPGHYFAHVSSQCIDLYRDGYFIGAVMMSHATNEGIVKYVAERNDIERDVSDGTMSIDEAIEKLRKKKVFSDDCADASIKIYKSYRNDIHHMNSTVGKIDFHKLAQQNLKYLSTIEKEIFGCKFTTGAIVPNQPKYWDINPDGTAPISMRYD